MLTPDIGNCAAALCSNVNRLFFHPIHTSLEARQLESTPFYPSLSIHIYIYIYIYRVFFFWGGGGSLFLSLLASYMCIHIYIYACTYLSFYSVFLSLIFSLDLYFIISLYFSPFLPELGSSLQKADQLEQLK